MNSEFQGGVNQMTGAFESFIDLGGLSQNQMIRYKKKQKMTAIMRATRFKTWIGSAVWLEGMESFSAENTYFSIEEI